jgi:hypothetical protein
LSLVRTASHRVTIAGGPAYPCGGPGSAGTSGGAIEIGTFLTFFGLAARNIRPIDCKLQ